MNCSIFTSSNVLVTVTVIRVGIWWCILCTAHIQPRRNVQGDNNKHTLFFFTFYVLRFVEFRCLAPIVLTILLSYSCELYATSMPSRGVHAACYCMVWYGVNCTNAIVTPVHRMRYITNVDAIGLNGFECATQNKDKKQCEHAMHPCNHAYIYIYISKFLYMMY